MRFKAERTDRFGLARPAVDVHTLGISSLEQLLIDCGCQVVSVGADVSEAFNHPDNPHSFKIIDQWIRQERITVLGVSYRLDPRSGAAMFSQVVHRLSAARLFTDQGGGIRGLFFAGLPLACAMVKQQHAEVAGVFCGDETPSETLRILGLDPHALPAELLAGVGYDQDRLSFGRDLVAKGEYLGVHPVEPGGYAEFGTKRDTLMARLRHHIQNGLPPIMRAHVGPYLPNRVEAVQLFSDWCRRLAASGHLDVLSIGTSQLTQSSFGEDWGARPNGGGVPLNSAEEFSSVWQAARPMLVRTYAGTSNIPELARMYEQTIHMAWHTLSFWWFCQIDGRGPHAVRENLLQHVETLKYIASTGKPFEPNVSHHFGFRGADDVSYVVSAFLAARVAKSQGIRSLIFQNMLNTPKYTWGVQDLAKSRATLILLRELQDEKFCVCLQPRGGLDYFSHDLDKARAQLAAVTALMDDIEPHDPASPPIIHVVSYSEASHLADPLIIDESIQITRHALAEYRRLRASGAIDDMANHPEVLGRTAELLSEARTVIQAIESSIPQPYSAEGLYEVFAAGFLPVPYLWECRDEFARAVQWPTRIVRGSVKVVNENGQPLPTTSRVRRVIGGH